MPEVKDCVNYDKATITCKTGCPPLIKIGKTCPYHDQTDCRCYKKKTADSTGQMGGITTDQ